MLSIRPFRLQDESAVISLWQACDLTRPWNDPHKDIQRKLLVQPELFLVGEAEGSVVASLMAGYEGHRGWLNYLAVLPAHQGRGYGRVLVRHVEQQLLALGCPKVNLQIRETNAKVMGFYESLGYARDPTASYGKRLLPDDA